MRSFEPSVSEMIKAFIRESEETTHLQIVNLFDESTNSKPCRWWEWGYLLNIIYNLQFIRELEGNLFDQGTHFLSCRLWERRSFKFKGRKKHYSSKFFVTLEHSSRTSDLKVICWVTTFALVGLKNSNAPYIFYNSCRFFTQQFKEDFLFAKF